MLEVRYFGVWDYVVFAFMLLISAAIGMYSALTGGRQRTAEEFFLGNRDMHVIPVAISIMVSFVSAISVIGTPGEVYVYDAMLLWNICIKGISAALACRLFVPLYFELQVTSIYEYLELRFSRPVRICTMIIFSIQTILYMGIVMYTPALAINAVTGMPLWVSVISTGVVCIFYTTVGGMKAVLWTDTLQALVMLIGMGAVIIKGSMAVGGLDEVWRRGVEGHRLDLLQFSFDPTVRYTVWGVAFGLGFGNLALIVTNQTTVQRLLSVGSRKKANQAILLSVVAFIIILLACIMSGIVMYAYYQDCDPYSAGYVHKTDQMMPFLVMELFADMPGLPGLFLSAVLSASLSTLSSGINSLAAVTGEDIIKTIWPHIKPRTYTWIIKGLAVLFGALCIGLAFLVSLFGQGVLQLAISLFGITGGGTLGVFLLGIYVHRSNSKGALCGLLTSVLFVGWIKLGSMAYPSERGKNVLSVEGCMVENVTDILYTNMSTSVDTMTHLMTSTASSVIGEPSASWPSVTKLYSVSFLYYNPIGVIVAMVVGIVVSAFTGFNDPQALDPKLKNNLTDALCCCCPESCKRVTRCGMEKSSLNDKSDTEIGLKVIHRQDGKRDDGTDIAEEFDLLTKPDWGETIWREDIRDATSISEA